MFDFLGTSELLWFTNFSRDSAIENGSKVSESDILPRDFQSLKARIIERGPGLPKRLT